MKIVIPMADGKLTTHFGHWESFALVDVDPVDKKILKREDIIPPPHEPGLLPPWLAERGVNMIIAGGMGQRDPGALRAKWYQRGGRRTGRYPPTTDRRLPLRDSSVRREYL